MSTGMPTAELHIPKGTTIFEQGDPGQEMYLIATGGVRLLIGSGQHKREIAQLGPGAFFGELSLLGNVHRTATAEASVDSVLLRISRGVFALMMQDDLEIVSSMMSIQGERLRQTNRPIEELSERMAEIRVGLLAMSRAISSPGSFPITVNLDHTAQELGMSREMVQTCVASFHNAGAGSIAGNDWHLQDAPALARLAEHLRQRAAA